jgi:hypothetical protein
MRDKRSRRSAACLSHWEALIQLPSYFGIRSLFNLARRKFARGTGFEVRYWSISELRHTFVSRIGPPELSVHCFFGLGLEPSDAHLMSHHVRWVVYISESLRKLSMKIPLLTHLADSVYVRAVQAGRIISAKNASMWGTI